MVGIYARAVCQLETDAKHVGNKCPPYPTVFVFTAWKLRFQVA